MGDEWTWVFCLLSHRSTQRRHHRESKPSSRGTSSLSSLAWFFWTDFSDFLFRLKHYRTSQFHLCYNFHFHLLNRKSWSLQLWYSFVRFKCSFHFFLQWVWLWNESIKHTKLISCWNFHFLRLNISKWLCTPLFKIRSVQDVHHFLLDCLLFAWKADVV